jgi:hypothetical protein
MYSIHDASVSIAAAVSNASRSSIARSASSAWNDGNFVR